MIKGRQPVLKPDLRILPCRHIQEGPCHNSILQLSEDARTLVQGLLDLFL